MYLCSDRGKVEAKSICRGAKVRVVKGHAPQGILVEREISDIGSNTPLKNMAAALKLL